MYTLHTCIYIHYLSLFQDKAATRYASRQSSQHGQWGWRACRVSFPHPWSNDHRISGGRTSWNNVKHTNQNLLPPGNQAMENPLSMKIFIGKLLINGPFSIVMFYSRGVNQRQHLWKKQKRPPAVFSCWHACMYPRGLFEHVVPPNQVIDHRFTCKNWHWGVCLILGQSQYQRVSHEFSTVYILQIHGKHHDKT